MFAAVMRQVIGNGQYPALAQALTAGALEDDVPVTEEPAPDVDLLWPELRFGLERVLDGIGALIERG